MSSLRFYPAGWEAGFGSQSLAEKAPDLPFVVGQPQALKDSGGTDPRRLRGNPGLWAAALALAGIILIAIGAVLDSA